MPPQAGASSRSLLIQQSEHVGTENTAGTGGDGAGGGAPWGGRRQSQLVLSVRKRELHPHRQGGDPATAARTAGPGVQRATGLRSAPKELKSPSHSPVSKLDA